MALTCLTSKNVAMALDSVGPKQKICSSIEVWRKRHIEDEHPWVYLDGLGGHRAALTLGVNGPIPVIVVDQFGYLTKASKIAVIRDPQMGYDSAVHFTPERCCC